jgi:phytoene synthase
LTNILRGVREDRGNGRIYIPEEDIRKLGADLTKHDERLVKPMSFRSAARPRLLRRIAAADRAGPPAQPPFALALIEIYRRLLGPIEHSDFDVLEKRIRVPTWEKLGILASAALR